MDQKVLEIGATIAVFLGFVVSMMLAEAASIGRWGVLLAVAAFVLAASGAGVAIADRAYE